MGTETVKFSVVVDQDGEDLLRHPVVMDALMELAVQVAESRRCLRTARIIATVAVIVAAVLAGCVLHLRHALTLQGHAATAEVRP